MCKSLKFSGFSIFSESYRRNRTAILECATYGIFIDIKRQISNKHLFASFLLLRWSEGASGSTSWSTSWGVTCSSCVINANSSTHDLCASHCHSLIRSLCLFKVHKCISLKFSGLSIFSKSNSRNRTAILECVTHSLFINTKRQICNKHRFTPRFLLGRSMCLNTILFNTNPTSTIEKGHFV